MIEIDICPIALTIGPFELRWYGIMVVLAVIAIISITLLEAKRVGFNQDHIYNLAIWAVISAVIFSRVVHVIDQWDYYVQNPGRILSFEGLGVYGAVIGVIVAIVIYCLVKKLSIWLVADLISPGALVGMAIGRIGCILNGCCYGLFTNLPWAVEYTCPDSYAPTGLPMHFTQLYHIIWNMAAFTMLWLLRRRLKPQGSVFLLYLAFYAAGDLLIRLFREGEPFLFGLQQAQVIGIIILLITLPWFFIRMWLYRRKPSVQ